MGYGLYDDLTGLDRFAGYGVPAYCDMPECDEYIDRGLGFRCSDPTDEDDEFHCGLYFCFDHRHTNRHEGIEWDGREHPEWIEHVLTHESWAQWRAENPAKVAAWRESA